MPILICPKCSNKLGFEFLNQKCPNPDCLYGFGTWIMELGNCTDREQIFDTMSWKNFRDASMTSAEAKKEYDLTKKDLDKIGSVTKLDKTRYLRADVAKFLRGKIVSKKPVQRKLFN